MLISSLQCVCFPDQELSQHGAMAPNPSPTEGVNTPNPPGSPCEDTPPSYMISPSELLYSEGVVDPAALASGHFQGMTPEQLMNLNISRTTQTGVFPQQSQPVHGLPSVNHHPNELPVSVTNRTLVEVDAQTDSNNDTPLTIAAAAGNLDIVRELLKSRADIEHKDKKGIAELTTLWQSV